MSDAAPLPLIEPDLVALDVDLGATKEEVIAGLARLVGAAGRAHAAGLAASALEREALSPTGMPGGFAIPHCRSAAVHAGSLGFARLREPVDFGAKDGPADLVFLIAAAQDGGADHMKLLTKLARALVKKGFLADLRAATSAEQIVELVGDVVQGPRPAGPEASADTVAPPAPDAVPARRDPAGPRRTVVAVTACPTGIAHTYMAADYLVAAGGELGVDVLVEPQGSSATTPLTAEQIAGADAAIFATDVGVKGRERFAGLPVVECGVKRAVNEPADLITAALAVADDPVGRRVAGPGATPSTSADAGASGPHGSSAGGLSFAQRLKQVLLTGVSYMIPFVAAGGLLIALAFAVGGYQVVDVSRDVVLQHSLWDLPAAYGDRGPLAVYVGSGLHQLGAAAFAFLVPALAGYIGFGIADRPGIAPGFTAGAVAVLVGAGFIGGLLGGLVAGVVAAWIAGLAAPRFLRGLMPVVIIPLCASLAAGGLLLVFGMPLRVLTEGLQGWLSGLSGTSAVVLGVILGLMMCFDLGGPVNKAAYVFATVGLNQDDPATLRIMAAVMAAGMVPPLAMALATLVRKQLFTPAERENGVAAWALGASFITEGAIPFAAADPLRVIPSMMAGGAVTGALSMVVGATSRAPHGGIFVFFAIGNVLLWLAAIACGAIVACAIVILAKGIGANGSARPEGASRGADPAKVGR